jgi:hypothetical protein
MTLDLLETNLETQIIAEHATWIKQPLKTALVQAAVRLTGIKIEVTRVLKESRT